MRRSPGRIKHLFAEGKKTGRLIYWQIYGIWLAIASGIIFILYGFDKAQSKRGGWRVPEAVLHGLALVGGFPGGWAGRSVFRHKTKKGLFVFVLAASTVIHLGLAGGLFWGGVIS
jgi:uncharacterized membrane protein YsdA (DUF1294 family)